MRSRPRRPGSQSTRQTTARISNARIMSCASSRRLWRDRKSFSSRNKATPGRPSANEEAWQLPEYQPVPPDVVAKEECDPVRPAGGA